MIACLRGQIIYRTTDSVVLDVHGVGYEIICSAPTLERLSLGKEVEVLTFTHVREDALILFGFDSQMEKELFSTLIKVNGVGPKLAISILSGAPVERILGMIEAEDIKGLCQLPKVGKKTAEQLVLSLKGKLPKLEANTIDGAKSKGAGGIRGEIVSGLVNLGFRIQDVEKVIVDLNPQVAVEEGIRLGLKALAQL